MSSEDTKMLLAMIEVYHPTGADCNKIAAAMGTGVTGNAIRQRIAKVRKNGPAAGGTTPSKSNNNSTTTTATPKKPRTPKSAAAAAANGTISDDEETPSKKKKTKGVVSGGGSRASNKRGKAKDEEGGDEDYALKDEPESPTKKLKREMMEEEGFGSYFDAEVEDDACV